MGVSGMKRILRGGILGLMVGVSMLTLGTAAPARSGGSGSGGGGGGSATDPTSSTNPAAISQVIKLDNIKVPYNGSQPKGKVTVGYAADGSAQSVTYDLSGINVPDGTQLPVECVTGVYVTIVSYYTYQIVQYTDTPGYVTVNKGVVSLTLSRANGDVIPDIPLPTVGTVEFRIYSPDGATLILDGSGGKLRP